MRAEYSFRARWSESLQKYGHTDISNVFLTNYSALGMTTSEAMFIILCFKHKWGVKEPFPSLNTIAGYMGTTRGTVQGYAKKLEEKGFIKRIFRKQQTNKYNFDPLISVLGHIAPYKDLDNESIKIAAKPYLKTNTKEDPLRIHKEELLNKMDINKY